jgi:hypothetical protein
MSFNFLTIYFILKNFVIVIKYNYIDDLLVFEGVEYQLSKYRRWLLVNHNQLCSGHFIKAIVVKGETKFTYDWQSIFLKSEEYEFLNDFINETNNR